MTASTVRHLAGMVSPPLPAWRRWLARRPWWWPRPQPFAWGMA
jgi:hypothetical protein